MIIFERVQNLRINPEIKSFLLEKSFSKSMLINSEKFAELIFLAFVDYYYIYKNNSYEILLSSLARKHNQISQNILNLLNFLKNLDTEFIKSGAHFQINEYLQTIYIISKYLQSATQKNDNIYGKNLFIVNLKYLLSLSATFRVFECTSTKNFTRSYGKNQTDIIYFIKFEEECHVIFPEIYPNEPISINYPLQYPRAILSCGLPITNDAINNHKCRSSSMHILYTQEKCLINLKIFCQQNKNACIMCNNEGQFAYICERCEGKHCLACLGHVRQFLCKYCGFSNIYQRFKNKCDAFANYQNAPRSAGPDYGSNNSAYQNLGNFNYSQFSSRPMGMQNQNYHQIPNPSNIYSQVPPIANNPICLNCKDYKKCKKCANLTYEVSPTGLCKSCLSKKCKNCNFETLSLSYCKKCQSCTNCNNPLENLLGCCLKCGLKKNFLLQIDNLEGESEIIFSSQQNDKCFKCYALLGISHKDTKFCCKCNDVKYDKMCNDCKKLNYAAQYGLPAVPQILPPKISLPQELIIGKLDVSNCKDCLNETNALVRVCICAKIVVPEIGIVESELESYIRNNFA